MSTSRLGLSRLVGKGFFSAFCLAIAFVAVSPAWGEVKYKNADEAFSVGAAFHNSRNYAASREPFEAALALAKDDAFRVKVYEALIPAYREIPDNEKMFTAIEFIISKSDQTAKQSLSRRSLLSFIQNRGLADMAVARYEGMLAKNPKDRTALFILSDVYADLKKDPKRAAEMKERLLAVDRQPGKEDDIGLLGELAQQYSKAKRFREAAETYERIAPRDKKLAAWNFKEAAVNYQKSNDRTKALVMAKASAASDPEARSEQLTHFWSRQLGEVFLELGEPATAIPYLEKAIASTKIDGYLKDCQIKLAEAKAKAKTGT